MDRRILTVGSTRKAERRRPSPSTLLVTITANLYLVLGTAVLATLAILSTAIAPGGRLVSSVSRLWSRGLLAASGIRLRVTRQTDLDPRQSYIFVANHQSLYDIPVLFSTLPGQGRFLAKNSLFRIPVFGWALSVGGFIPVDRENRSRASEAFASAVRRLRRGVSIVLFPEETRSTDGRLLPFRRGGVLLALKSRLPIVPVGIRGTLAVRRKGDLLVRPGRVEVCYGRPIDASTYGLRGKRDLLAKLEDEVARLAGAERAAPVG